MKLFSNNVKDNHLEEVFGNNTSEPLVNGMVKKSFHLAWSQLPANTKSLAIYFYDDDAIPVAGFSWIHWTAANINPSWNELPVNASVEWKDKFVQGKNSWASGLLPKEGQDPSSGFGGCAPPNADHEYTVKVYALDTMLNLVDGFDFSDLKKAMKNHILDEGQLTFIYKKLK